MLKHCNWYSCSLASICLADNLPGALSVSHKTVCISEDPKQAEYISVSKSQDKWEDEKERLFQYVEVSTFVLNKSNSLRGGRLGGNVRSVDVGLQRTQKVSRK